MRTLEKSRHVKALIKDLNSHLLKQKNEYNSFIHIQHQIISEIKLLEQQLSDLSMPEKSELEKEKRIEQLSHQFIELQKKIIEESLYTECLEHMADIRKQNLDAIADPARALRKRIIHANATNQILYKEADYHETVAKTIKFKLSKLQEVINNQRETMRDTLNQELAKYEERCKAIAFYKTSQQTWYKKKELETKTEEIKDLEYIEIEEENEKKILKELEKVQNHATHKEIKIAEALKNTNSHSLNDLNIQLIQLKETKESLINLQADLEQRIYKQRQEIIYLNDQYQRINFSKVEKEDDYHILYDLENNVAIKEKTQSNQELNHIKMKSVCSAALLGLQRLIQKIGTNDDTRSFKSVSDAIDFISRKIQI